MSELNRLQQDFHNSSDASVRLDLAVQALEHAPHTQDDALFLLHILAQPQWEGTLTGLARAKALSRASRLIEDPALLAPQLERELQSLAALADVALPDHAYLHDRLADILEEAKPPRIKF